jgi:2-polyprenyl-6-methoxyphenol hydroxylase-like FAD-dependent oxidoreductase
VNQKSKHFSFDQANPVRWYDTTGGILAMETLIAATPLATYLPTLNHRMKDVSPAKRVFLTQHMLMRILRQRAKSLPLITFQYNCAIVELTQDDNQVIAKTNSGMVSAKYCVGCDGAAGITRGIVTGNKVSGHGLVNTSRTIVFRVIFPFIVLILGGLETLSKVVS